ncbi:MAG: hypothetical protein JSW25_08860 [Thermoplasmata archaeon]|nr:MAG: hypothetical protein JSW25_08860 [Thermoplasmata archaeon]
MGQDDEPAHRRTLTDEERYRILRRLHATLSWVGVRIPEELDLDGERVELRNLVDRFVFDDYIDDEERKEVLALIDKLEDKAEILEDALEEEDLTLEEAEEILYRAIGVLRAIDELKHLEDEEEWEDQRRVIMEKVDDAKRWRDFTNRVYKKDEYY